MREESRSLNHETHRALWVSGCLGVLLAAAAAVGGATDRTEAAWLCLAVGALALLAGRRARAPRTLVAPIALLTAWTVVQLIPLPLSWVAVLSPLRYEAQLELTELGLAAVFAPLSFAPARTLDALLLLLAAAAAFALARDAARTLGRRAWAAAAPLIVVGAAEALWGLYEGAAPGGEAVSGSYANHNHFAGLLEIALPFAAVSAVLALVAARRGDRVAVWGCAAAAATALTAAGVLSSLSRAGFVAVAVSLLLTAAALSFRRERPLRSALIAGTAAAALVLSAGMFAPPSLIERFARLGDPSAAPGEGRIELWIESLELVKAVPWTGCGAGAYEPAFVRFKRSAPQVRDDYAHNDYMQATAEMGLPGLALWIWLAVALAHRLGRAAQEAVSVPERALALASMASLTAISLHGLADFNLRIPANALATSWAAGLGVGVTLGRRHRDSAGRFRLLSDDAIERCKGRTHQKRNFGAGFADKTLEEILVDPNTADQEETKTMRKYIAALTIGMMSALPAPAASALRALRPAGEVELAGKRLDSAGVPSWQVWAGDRVETAADSAAVLSSPRLGRVEIRADSSAVAETDLLRLERGVAAVEKTSIRAGDVEIRPRGPGWFVVANRGDRLLIAAYRGDAWLEAPGEEPVLLLAGSYATPRRRTRPAKQEEEDDSERREPAAAEPRAAPGAASTGDVAGATGGFSIGSLSTGASVAIVAAIGAGATTGLVIGLSGEDQQPARSPSTF